MNRNGRVTSLVISAEHTAIVWADNNDLEYIHPDEIEIVLNGVTFSIDIAIDLLRASFFPVE